MYVEHERADGQPGRRTEPDPDRDTAAGTDDRYAITDIDSLRE